MTEMEVVQKTNKLVIRIKTEPQTNDSINQKTNTTAGLRIGWVLSALLILGILFGVWYVIIDANVATSDGIRLTVPVEQEINSKTIIAEAETSLPSIETNEELTPEPVSTGAASLVLNQPELESVEPQESTERDKIPEMPDIVQAAEPAPKALETAVVPSTQSEQIISTGNIARAIFCNDVVDHEPVNPIEGIYPAKKEGLKRVYFFSEFTQMKGQTVYHRWYHQNKFQSEIKFAIKGNRWRVHSSKRIIPSRTGVWRVEIVDANKQVLTSREFQYGDQ